MFQKNQNIIYFSFLLLVFSFSAVAQKKQSATKELVYKMIKSIDDVQGLKYNLKIIERGKKGFNNYHSSVKFIKNPRTIYIYISPGIELLWKKNWNNNKAYVKPNSFPYMNLSLDPLGNLMRQDQHHTINEMGFDYFGSIIEYLALKVNDKFDDYFTLLGEEKYNNRNCYKIIINNKDFAYENYLVKGGESITTIARKNHISEYMIVEANPKLNDYFDLLKTGQTLKIPNAYAKDVTLYVDVQHLLPIGIKVGDNKGLFEQYDYHFLQVNPKFDDAEFSTKYPDYKF